MIDASHLGGLVGTNQLHASLLQSPVQCTQCTVGEGAGAGGTDSVVVITTWPRTWPRLATTAGSLT